MSSKLEIPRPRIEEIVAVVVTYNPDSRLSRRLARVAQQVSKIIVVDNRSTTVSPTMLQEAVRSVGAQLLRNSSNLGVATALNQGIRESISQGYRWILMLDQDSLPEPGMVESLTLAYDSFPEPDKLAIIAPVPVDERSRYVDFSDVCKGKDYVEMPMVQTSGSLMSAHAFAVTGPLREDFFIDYVDFEHCFRLKRKGFSVVVSCKARLLHNLGATVRRRFLWKESMSVTNYDRIRRYYITRNRLLMMKEYAPIYPAWAIEELIIFGKDLVKIIFFENDRKAKLHSMFIGTRDAIFNRTGRLPQTSE